MKKYVVLGADVGRRSWLAELLGRLQPAPRFAYAESAQPDCDGILIVDDGTPDGFAAIRSAIALRARNPALPIAVLTTLDPAWTDESALAQSQRRLGGASPSEFSTTLDGMHRLLRSRQEAVRVRIDPQAIGFDYGD